jgi:hypothetical protein
MKRTPKKTGSYFPPQINHRGDTFIVEQRYGNDGYAFWFKLLELLGRTEGHSLDCNKMSTWQYLCTRSGVDDGVAMDILNLLADLNAIDSELWKIKKTIWSDNFVNGLSFAYRNRNVSIPDKPVIYTQESGICGTTNSRKPQMKVNEMKVNEKKLIASPEAPDGANGDARPVYECSSFSVGKDYFTKLLTDYPALTEPILTRELNKMGDWLTDNPKKHKRTARGHIKNPKMFIRNWIERMDIKPGGDKAWYE